MRFSLCIILALLPLYIDAQSITSNYPRTRFPMLYAIDSSGKVKIAKLQPKMCGALKGGLICMGVGVASYLIGTAVIQQHYNSLPPHSSDVGDGDGIYGVLFGVLSFGVGTGLTIGGGIHDVVRHHKHRLSICVPTGNRIGIAYGL
jgi:hypothetical protein